MLKPLLILTTCFGLLACQPEAETPSTLHVSGSGSVTAIPDQVRLHMTVQYHGDNLTALKQQVDTTTMKVLEQLRSMEIDDDDIQSYRLFAYPQYDYNDGKRTQTGYEVRRDIQIVLRTPDFYDTLIEQALAAGVTGVSTPVYEVSRTNELYQEALALAVADAAKKAATLASSAQVTLQGVATIHEQSSAPRVAAHRDMAMAREQAVSLPGTSTISANVSISYAIN